MRLVLHNDLTELERLAGWIADWAQQGVSPDLSFAIQLCLEEAVANVIMYAAAKDHRLDIVVELERSDGTLIARIEDTGRQFDPTQFLRPTVARSLEDAKVGDLGIHLIRSFASGVDYERLDGRNRLTLRFVESQVTSTAGGTQATDRAHDAALGAVPFRANRRFRSSPL
jgi:anti-sigma regulatory factor (Ser/Thr protein kinase)